MLRRLLVVLIILLAPATAWAQCVGGLIVKCPGAASLQPTDILLGYQLAQTPHYRAVTVQQITGGGFAGAFSTLNATGGGALSGPFTFLSGLSVTGTLSVSGPLGASGIANLSGGLTEAGSANFAGNVTMTASGTGLAVTDSELVGGTLGVTGLSSLALARLRLQNFSLNSEPTPFGAGDVIYETDCVTATGTGCPAFANGSGTYVRYPYPPPIGITFGSTGLVGLLGGFVPTQGNGGSLASAGGTFVSGNQLTTNTIGTIVDSGVPVGSGGGGGGGSGTVSDCTAANSISIYATVGITVSCLGQTNNSVVTRSAGGVLSESATLPSGLTAPNLNLTGTTTAGAINLTGALTPAAPTAGGANIFCPAGTVPTSPSNGSEWCTTAGHFGRYATPGTVGPFIGLAQLSVSDSTIAYSNTTGVFTCPVCVTTWTGPLAFTSKTASLANFPWLALWEGDATVTVHNDTYYLPAAWRYASGTISDIYFWTGAGSFLVTVQVNGSNLAGCTNVSVTTAYSPTSRGTATCSGGAVTHNQPVALIISSAAGSPISAGVGIDGSFTP